MSDAERMVAVGGITLVVAVILWRVIAWLLSGKTTPDPWGDEVTEQIDRPEVQPLCCHCFTPHNQTEWFCPNCGAAVGDYNNTSPYLYIFSLGEGLREGAFGRVRRSVMSMIGYVLLSLAEYTVFAPFYWFRLSKNLQRREPATEPSISPAP